VVVASGEFRVTVDWFGTRVESRSGAGVHAVRTVDGEAAYLKVTPAALGPRALAAARRELRFYQELAPVVPVHTPRLLDSLDTEEGVAVLLAAAGKPRAAALWTEEMWASLGRNLAALHGMRVPEAGNWGRPDALPEIIAAPSPDEVNDFWADALPTLMSLRAELQERIGLLPPVLVHGDCHLDNIVHGTSSPVFCDWQATGIGRPVSDLAFLSVRATPSGTAVPRVLVDAYLDNSPHDRRRLESALVAEELATLVFLWPPYATFNSPAGIERIRRRARDLADRFLADPDHQ
jgi:Ser/Thr protein kinase RdoA (MazF antagonist)